MTLPLVALSDLNTFLLETCAAPESLPRKVTLNEQHHLASEPSQATLWVSNIQTQARMDVSEVVQECYAFFRDMHQHNHSEWLRAWVFNFSENNCEEHSRGYIAILEIKPIPRGNIVPSNNPSKTRLKLLQWFTTSRYELLATGDGNEDDNPPGRYFLRSRKKVFVLLLLLSFLLAALVVLAALFLKRPTSTWSEDGYIRYATPGSEGPKRQTRIYYRNATEWAHKNPHSNGEWKIRLDDQAIVPSEAWDSDEDRYQEWFHARYAEMHDVIETGKYIRPSWLGSLNIFVPWDKEFHLAHCVVTLRRYWKAKETGKHVCSRDIDYDHIQHCLNWMDGLVFSPNPGTIPEMSTHMIWQTKLCY
ncbi:hypothetical protein AK830_g8411 [Neonectria ditissima]|uniref:Uncharacterized protein n=1 Tax=Neonectria ditissima TaxID=78410 RepID=A0A0P7B855_9HYPO|nr:hypothetical protein AK830_g8411 [Neonectria ditissima]